MTRILLVEDNEMNREMLGRRLRRSGFDVMLAVDGRQGIHLAREYLPDLVLMDLGLPEIDGWEATRILKSDLVTREIPVLALTAHAMVGDRERALKAGCDEYTTKPVHIAALLDL